MSQFNPPHPGEFIQTVYLDPLRVSGRELAEKLALSPSIVGSVLAGRGSVNSDMASRLSAALGRSPDSWLAMQSQYDLWLARKVDFD